MSEPALRRTKTRNGRRDLAGSRRADLAAFALAIAISAIVLLATLWLATIQIAPRLERLEAASTEAAQTLAEAVADDFAQAVALGIPLAEMRGVEPYLGSILRSETLVSAITVRDPQEKLLFAVPPETADPLSLVRAQIIVDRESVGTIVAAPSRQIAAVARQHLVRAAIAAALLVGLVCGILMRIALLERLNLQQARVGVAAGAVGRGTFGEFTPPRAGTMVALGRSAGLLLGPIRREQRRLLALTDEVRALDTFGQYRDEIAAALEPLSRFSFDRPRKPFKPTVANALWWPFAALTMLFATRPLVASFAADRVDLLHEPLAVGAAIAASGVGAIAGFAAAYGLGGRAPKLTAMLSLLIAAFAIGITAVVRDPNIFTALQFAAGLFGALAVGSTFATEGAFARLPWRTGLVLIGAAAVGPTLGALIAEAAGRRLSFAAVGGLAAIVALAAAAGPPRRPAARRPRWGLPVAAGIALAATGFALASWIEVDFSARALREDYAGLGFAAALTGACAFLPFALPGSPRRAYIVAGAALIVAIFAVAKFVDPGLQPTPGVAAALGLALGLVARGAGSRAFGFGGATALAAGTVLAAINEAGTFVLPGQAANVALGVSVAAFLGVLATLGRR